MDSGANRSKSGSSALHVLCRPFLLPDKDPLLPQVRIFHIRAEGGAPTPRSDQQLEVSSSLSPAYHQEKEGPPSHPLQTLWSRICVDTFHGGHCSLPMRSDSIKYLMHLLWRKQWHHTHTSTHIHQLQVLQPLPPHPGSSPKTRERSCNDVGDCLLFSLSMVLAWDPLAGLHA